VSNDFCAAVGSYQNAASESFTLAELWNGTTWRLVGAPNQSNDQGDNLNAVSCISATFCRAVGDYITNETFPVNQTLIEKWNGTTWSLVTAPDRATDNNNLLEGTACVSTTSCTAIGFYEFQDRNAETLIERSNGRGWSLVASPDRSATEDNILFGVSCVGTGFCVAAGSYLDNPLQRTLIETWDGTSWTASNSPNRGSGNNLLAGVS